MPLTDTECKQASCPPDRPLIRLADEKGMYLEITKAGGKYWRMKYRHAGKEKVIALGVYGKSPPEVTLAQARKARDQAREALASGDDPAQLKREAKLSKAINDATTFEGVARQWWAHWSGPKSPRHADYVLRRLEADVFPALGARPVASVTARALLFPGERDHEKPMSNNTILGALKRMGYAGRMTGHGFRGVASTILHEQGYGHHLIELQLAHQERNATVAAYNHATYLTDRMAMMQGWANHIDKLRKGADVIPLPQRAA